MTGFKRPAARRGLLLLALAILLVIGTPAAAQGDIDLRITGIDLSAFPQVRARVLATDRQSAPLAVDVGFVLREDGVPIPDTLQAGVPVGVDLAFLIDANPELMQSDAGDSSATRRDIVVAGIGRYAAGSMSPTGLDRVSVIVPNETGDDAAFLLRDGRQPGELSRMMDAYAPTPAGLAPLDRLLATAIDDLAAKGGDGRFRAILLYTDGGRAVARLDAQPIAEAARAAGVPIFVAILGREASPEEIAAVSRLSGPTRGQVIHMPEPPAADPFYALFRAAGQQTEITYRSVLRENGDHRLSVTLGNTTTEAPFSLDLRAPLLRLEAPAAAINRVGTAPDTPLALLQPAAQPLTAIVSWPDGQPRALGEFTFLVNGSPVVLAAAAAPDAAGQIPILWDISALDAGDYSLEVRGRDELGYETRSEPLTVSISTSRPVPTPAPTPTAAPPVVPPVEQLLSGDLPIILGGLLGLLALGLAGVAWSRRRKAKLARRRAALNAPVPDERPRNRLETLIPYLERLDAAGRLIERTRIDGDGLTIGRDPQHATLVIDDPGVAGLHARIRRNADDSYWLYDEGSSSGTFLNYERLGLAPREMRQGDAVTIGRVPFRFALELPDQAAATKPTEAPAAAPPADAPDKETPAD